MPSPKKFYQCEICGTRCQKKFARALCSDKCHFLGFVDQFENQDQCWSWNGTIKRDGYGVLKSNGKWTKAHRHSYALFKEPINPGMLILHSCHVPKCVNPSHLRQGTHKENSLDMVNANRWDGGRPSKTN